MAELGLKHWKTFQTNYLIPLIEKGWLERTIPDKPRSRLQRYRITAAGRQVLVAPFAFGSRSSLERADS